MFQETEDDLSFAKAFADLPGMPDFEAEDFRYSVDTLEGIEEYMVLTPNAPSANFAAYSLGHTQPAPPVGMRASPSTSAAAVAATTPTESLRKTFNNRMAQKRFRERQKVAAAAVFFVCNNLKFMGTCSVWPYVQERTASLQAELAKTSAQLQELQALQTSLKTKNQLLTKLVDMNMQAEFKSCPEPPATNAVSSERWHAFSVVSHDPEVPIQSADSCALAHIWFMFSVCLRQHYGPIVVFMADSAGLI